MSDVQAMYRYAKRIIPGGGELLSKRPEMFLPDQWPSYYRKAQGCRVEAYDNKTYLDFCLMGVGANTLGYANPEVDEAVISAISQGSMCTLNAYEEVELAERLLALHPWADMARFAKTGGEACAIAIRLARAATGRDVVLACGYHGCQDWYLAANLSGDDELGRVHLAGLSPVGIPWGLRDTIATFHYNDIEEFRRLCDAYEGRVGAIIMEPVRTKAPLPGFLEEVRDYSMHRGVPLIFDEISMGFRLTVGGSHIKLGVEPDVALFGKAFSNGFPVTAIVGKESVMSHAQRTFLSSTYWTDRIGFAAACKTIDIYQRDDVPQRLDAIGLRVQGEWRAAADASGLNISIAGVNPLSHFSIIGLSDNGGDAVDAGYSRAWATLFTQLMLERGFLANGSFYASTAHDESSINSYGDAVRESFGEISQAMRSGVNPTTLLKGPVAHQSFERLV